MDEVERGKLISVQILTLHLHLQFTLHRFSHASNADLQHQFIFASIQTSNANRKLDD